MASTSARWYRTGSPGANRVRTRPKTASRNKAVLLMPRIRRAADPLIHSADMVVTSGMLRHHCPHYSSMAHLCSSGNAYSAVLGPNVRTCQGLRTEADEE